VLSAANGAQPLQVGSWFACTHHYCSRYSSSVRWNSCWCGTDHLHASLCAGGSLDTMVAFACPCPGASPPLIVIAVVVVVVVALDVLRHTAVLAHSVAAEALVFVKGTVDDAPLAADHARSPMHLRLIVLLILLFAFDALSLLAASRRLLLGRRRWALLRRRPGGRVCLCSSILLLLLGRWSLALARASSSSCSSSSSSA
jgi:hypothetical protein